MTATYAGHFTEPPRDENGRPIPSAEFQLFLPGTSTPPTYYTDRVKTSTQPGNPTSDSFGNVDIFVEPGIYDYWYDGMFIQSMTVSEDNGEDDVGLAALQSYVDNALADISVGAAYAPGGTADDTVALQAYIDGLQSGGEVLFAPGRTYTISQAIKYRDDLTYRAPGNSHGTAGAEIKQKAGTNLHPVGVNPLSALFVPYGYFTNEDTTGLPTRFSNIRFNVNIDQNPSTTVGGLLTLNFWTWIEECFFTGADAAGYGLVLSDTTADGSTISNSSSEPIVRRNRFDGCKGLYVQCTGEQANLDGICEENKFTGIFGTAAEWDRAAGWEIKDNHFYGGGQFGTAIAANNCFATMVGFNYIEDFGGKGTSGDYYSGITCHLLDGWGTRILGNQIGSPEIAGSTSQYIAVTSGSDQADTHVVIADNICNGSGSSDAIGLVLQNNPAGVVNYASARNIITGFESGKQTYIEEACVAETLY